MRLGLGWVWGSGSGSRVRDVKHLQVRQCEQQVLECAEGGEAERAQAGVGPRGEGAHACDEAL